MITENVRAKSWRLRRGMSIDDLVKLSGYSKRAIMAFEAGRNSNKTPIAESAWTRYKRVCASIDAQLRLKHHFRW